MRDEVTAPTHERSFTTARVQTLLGLSRGTISRLVTARFVSPARGSRNEHRFSFQDVMLLRTAHSLRAARITPKRIMHALEKLRAALPPDVPLTGLRIIAVGSEVTVHDRAGHWSADSGQMLLDFEVAAVEGQLSILPARDSQAPRPLPLQDWFTRGEALEASDPAGAEAAYRQAIEVQPGNADAWLNLGALLCESARCHEAVALYERALVHCPDTADIHFNRAIALEDQGELHSAVASYERCLALDPGCADAHFNRGRLCEQLGDERGVLRDFNAYRRLRQG